jgi:hypothetical protein
MLLPLLLLQFLQRTRGFGIPGGLLSRTISGTESQSGHFFASKLSVSYCNSNALL